MFPTHAQLSVQRERPGTEATSTMYMYCCTGYRCPVEECGCVFTKWTDLRKHLPTHPKGSLLVFLLVGQHYFGFSSLFLVCEVCQKTFTRNRQVSLHTVCIHHSGIQFVAKDKWHLFNETHVHVKLRGSC